LGYGYGVTGKRAEAIAVIKELEEKYARKEAVGRYIAAVYAGLGEKDKAFEWLEKDFQTRNGELGSIRWSIPVSIPKAKQEKAFAELEKAFEERLVAEPVEG